MTKRLLSFIVLCSMLFTSCEMMENAKQASKNSGNAAAAASDSVGILKRSVVMTRPGAAKEARAKALERLEDAKSIEGKVVEAATFFKAFEYQLWLGKHFDSDTYLQSLYEDAMNELYRQLKEVNGDKKISKTNPTAFRINPWRKKRDANILGLSLGMHKVHGLQITVRPIDYELQDGTIFTFNDESMGVSVLDLIKEALIKIDMYENGQIAYGELMPYQVVVYENIEEFVTLLNVRYNMILTLALAELTEVEENSFTALTAMILPTSWKKIESEYMDINEAKRRKANKYLEEAFKLKDFMQNVGAIPYMYNDIQNIFKKIVHPSRADEDMIILSVDDQKSINKYYGALENLFKISGNRIIDII